MRVLTADGVRNLPDIPAKSQTEAELILQYEAAIDRYINSRAAEKNYDSRITIAMRCGYTGPWQQECLAFALWMDKCYQHCYKVIDDYRAGLRPIPTVEQIISEFPVLVW